MASRQNKPCDHAQPDYDDDNWRENEIESGYGTDLTSDRVEIIVTRRRARSHIHNKRLCFTALDEAALNSGSFADFLILRQQTQRGR